MDGPRRRHRCAPLLAVGLVAALAGCAAPVRLATPEEVRHATAPTPTPSQAAAAVPPPGAAAAPPPSPPAGEGASGSGVLAALQGDYVRAAALQEASVVQIDTGGGLGSGVVMDAQGDIVTNAHVVGSASSFTVTMSDGSSHPGSLVGSYAANDLAVVRAAGAGGLRPASFGDSSAVHLGDVVLAIGSPLGLADSVSEGIVSGLGRSQSEGGGVNLTGLIQTTAAIGPGNSGGALVDIAGRVIGMPTLSAAGSPRSGPAPSIGFAIPSNQIVNVSGQLVSGGTVTRTNLPYLGITTSSAASGAQVDAVVAGGPADRAGVQAGWVVTALAGRPVPDPSAISQILSGHKPGDRVDLTARLPDGSTRTVTITLGERPAGP